MLDRITRVSDAELTAALNQVNFIVALGDGDLVRLYVFSRSTDRLLAVQDICAGERPHFLD
jgi:hypothetical protein